MYCHALSTTHTHTAGICISSTASERNEGAEKEEREKGNPQDDVVTGVVTKISSDHHSCASKAKRVYLS